MSGVPRWRLVLGVTLMLLASGVVATTLIDPLIGVAVVFVGVALAIPSSGLKLAAATMAVIPSVALVARTLNFRPVGDDPVLANLAPGEYVSDSGDLFGWITVRVVLRGEPGAAAARVIFAEAHAPAILGFHAYTLTREARRLLELQAVPKAPDPQSEPATAIAVLGAFRRALSGAVAPQAPTVPDGGTAESYWGMFPNEFDHRCNVAIARDGDYDGVSSNPNHPARVRVSFRGGRIMRVEVLDGHHSEYGAPAFASLPTAMANENRVDVDVVSGATRSSWILRSAAYDACRKAGGAPVPAPADSAAE